MLALKTFSSYHVVVPDLIITHVDDHKTEMSDFDSVFVNDCTGRRQNANFRYSQC